MSDVEGPPCDLAFRGLFPGSGKRDGPAGVGGGEARVGSNASGPVGTGVCGGRVALCPQHRHT